MGDIAGVAVKEEHDATRLSRRDMPGMEANTVLR